MRALLRKEWRQLRPATWVVAAIAFLWYFERGSARYAFVAPIPVPQWNQWVFAWVLGGAVGFFQVAYEEWSGSRPYLWHRSVSVGRVLVAKSLVAWVILFVAVLFPGLAAYAALRWTAEFGPILQVRRLVELGALCTAGVAAHGIAAWAATLPLSRSFQLIVAVACTLGFAGLSGLSLAFDWGEPDLRAAVFAAANVSLGIVALLLARARILHGTDPLASTSARVNWGSAGLLLVFTGGLVWLTLGGLATRWQARLLRRYPMIVLDAVPGPRLAIRHAGGGGQFLDDGATIPEGQDWMAVWRPSGLLYMERFDVLDFFGGEWHVGQSWRSVEDSWFRKSAYLDRHTGELHLFRDPSQARWMEPLEPVASEHVTCEHRFSPETEVLVTMPPGVPVVDPGDLSLWTIERDPYRLAPAPLPDGQRFVEYQSRMYRQWALAGIRHPGWNSIVGEKGIYSWDEDGWKLVPDEDLADSIPAAEFDEHRRYEFSLRQGNGPTPSVSFRSIDTGGLAFEHRFAPDDAWSTALLAGIRTLRSLRAPLLALTSFLRDPREAEVREYTLAEPELYGRQRADLVAWNTLVAAVLAGFAFRRSQRTGATRRECIAWAVIVLATGLAGFLTQWVFLPRTATVRVRARCAVQPEEPLLRTMERLA